VGTWRRKEGMLGVVRGRTDRRGCGMRIDSVEK
jgi:hypothetical protein